MHKPNTPELSANNSSGYESSTEVMSRHYLITFFLASLDRETRVVADVYWNIWNLLILKLREGILYMSAMWEETEKQTLDEELHSIFSVRIFFFAAGLLLQQSIRDMLGVFVQPISAKITI